jgi:L-rhamnose mutarotase
VRGSKPAPSARPPYRRHRHPLAGWANYSIFLADDGLLVGYLETDDYPAALRRMAQTGVNDRWQAEMAPFFAGIGGQRPDEEFTRLPEIFHLD